MPYFTPTELGEGYFELIEKALFDLQEHLNLSKFKEKEFHKNNLANKQIGKIITDIGSMRVIIHRLVNDQSSLEINHDLKSLYIFSKIFVESVIFFCSIFYSKDKHLYWEKLGEFCKTVREKSEKHSEEFKNYWTELGPSILKLQSEFRYRNFVAHEKNNTNEWTFLFPGRNNLDNTKIENISWPEDENKTAQTVTPREIINLLNQEIPKIFNFLKNSLLK